MHIYCRFYSITLLLSMILYGLILQCPNFSMNLIFSRGNFPHHWVFSNLHQCRGGCKIVLNHHHKTFYRASLKSTTNLDHYFLKSLVSESQTKSVLLYILG